MNREHTFEFRAFRDSVEISDRRLLFYDITFQPSAACQRNETRSMSKTSGRGLALTRLLGDKSVNGNEVAEYLINTFMLNIIIYQTDEEQKIEAGRFQDYR